MGKKLRATPAQSGPTKPHITDPELLRAVSRPVALAVLRLSPDQFDRLTKAGVLRKAPRYGCHDLLGLVEDRLKLAEDENGADAGDITIAEAKRRFWAAKALSEELAAAKTSGELVPIVTVEELERECLATLAVQMDGLAPRLAAELAGLSDAAVVRRRLLTELRRVRAEAARRLACREGYAAAAEDDGGDADAGARSAPA
jgi:hypothetical protein